MTAVPVSREQIEWQIQKFYKRLNTAADGVPPPLAVSVLIGFAFDVATHAGMPDRVVGDMFKRHRRAQRVSWWRRIFGRRQVPVAKQLGEGAKVTP